MKLIYHDDYDLNLGAHVFPSQKYRLIHDRLASEGCEFVTPEPAPDEDLLLVHGRGWVTRLKMGTLHEAEIQRLEIPWSQKMADAFRLSAGGTTLAARHALTEGAAFNVGGGFHHAFANHGEGFCAIHDVAVAIRKLQQERVIEKALVVDVDVHQGNGTAAIFASDDSVFTLSIHQYNNYPHYKPPSNIDVHLEDGVGDDEYIHALDQAVEKALRRFTPQILMYVAGADPYKEDQLGGLALTIDGLMERDRLVFGVAKHAKIPVCVTLAGGYARQVEDTVTIHANTAKCLKEFADRP
ncbi:MAG TPA: histone deacetylase [Bryobacteraceae bacterium]|nr:histone deacetylase [Bryobacteraceae bacterium]